MTDKEISPVLNQANTDETERIEFLFELYNEYTAPLLQEEGNGKGKKR